MKRRKNMKTLSKFIEDANKVHNNKYSYEKSVYKGVFIQLTITCPIHGDFLLQPTAHTTKKQGCPHCAKEEFKRKVSLGKEKFVEKAKKIHGDKYDYSEVEYVNNYTYVKIICPFHGMFMQEPHSHLKGCGCPHCKESKLERTVKMFLEDNEIDYERQYTTTFLEKQKLDFYLPKYGIGIECQGVQHLRGKWFRDERQSHDNKIIESDIKKHHSCKENGIKLLYFVNRESEKVRMIEDEKFKSIYHEDNTFSSLPKLLAKIKGEP